MNETRTHGIAHSHSITRRLSSCSVTKPFNMSQVKGTAPPRSGLLDTWVPRPDQQLYALAFIGATQVGSFATSHVRK